MGGVTGVTFAATSAVTLYILAVAIGATSFNIKNSTAGHRMSAFMCLLWISE